MGSSLWKDCKRSQALIIGKLELTKDFCLPSGQEAWSWLETYRTGKDYKNLREPLPARRRKKRRRSGVRPHRDRVLGTMKTQASQGNRAAIQAGTSLAESPTSDKDKISHTDAGETEDSLYHESVVDPLGDLPHVTPQTAEDII
ncbi:hypothetical protein NDU88_001633 [Pleurodeles waltl]|uniref:Uncharacterized protein n=1 Tax=Pleurodeles waltl TaxID=8319 RepID=A0AAV7T0W9_PLEWA|nr:hypothetical protein NDU88_001633 [Pleurodeles waltl]